MKKKKKKHTSWHVLHSFSLSSIVFYEWVHAAFFFFFFLPRLVPTDHPRQGTGTASQRLNIQSMTCRQNVEIEAAWNWVSFQLQVSRASGFATLIPVMSVYHGRGHMFACMPKVRQPRCSRSPPSATWPARAVCFASTSFAWVVTCFRVIKREWRVAHPVCVLFFSRCRVTEKADPNFGETG